MTRERIYRVIFHNQGQVYEIYASEVQQTELMGFVEVAGLRFGERSQVVVDPSEERLKAEFEGVKRMHIPMHAVVRIDEVEKAGPGKISEAQGNIAQFPSGSYSPGRKT
ncbi:DUF1820 family protein [Methylonatrum kenyense]|uniref:DUF1820 family protein n=1 Tax=Methylonatrum kenyense TaxID=455253 RepID=UPI0020C12095|nr:DUF1820 family protein [Methylonatrum kenyense]MCK8515755.1 DUF1820 family protein [Methylonatrum kenyense]